MSSYQPNVDWAQVAAAGYKFGFVKASEGVGYTNPYFAQDWQAIASVGLVRGAYHFAQPEQNSPVDEADYFRSVLGPTTPEDILILDLEVGSSDLKDWAIGFALALGSPPMLYSGVPFMQAHNLDNAEVCQAFGDKLWIAAYTTSKPALPAGWPVMSFWQKTDGATVPGIAGRCDLSVYLP